MKRYIIATISGLLMILWSVSAFAELSYRKSATDLSGNTTDQLSQGATNKYANTTKEDNGQTAYDWGNHSLANYANGTDLSNHTGNATPHVSSGNRTAWDGVAANNHTAASGNISQSGTVANTYFSIWTAANTLANATYTTADAVNWNTAYSNFFNKSSTLQNGWNESYANYWNKTRGNWKVFYSNDTGVITELALPASGYLKSNGVDAAPSWDTPTGTGSGDANYSFLANNFNGTGNFTTTGFVNYGQTKNLRLAFEGDSLTDANYSTYPVNLTQHNGYFGQALFNNFGTTGKYAYTMAGQYPTHAGAAAIKPSATGDQGYFFIMGGINDLVSTDNTSAEVYTSLKNTWALAKADRYKVVAFTVGRSSSLNATEELRRQNLTELIFSDPTLYDYVIRPDVLFNNLSDTNYFADQTHLTALGYSILANMTDTAITRLPYLVIAALNNTRNISTFDLILNPGGHFVGINTLTPNATLQVVGTLRATTLYGDGANITGINSSYSNFTNNETADINWTKNLTVNRMTSETDVTVNGTGNASIQLFGENNYSSLLKAYNFTGNWTANLPDADVTLVGGNGTQAVSNVVCWKSATQIGQCVGAVNATGNCTCE